MTDMRGELAEYVKDKPWLCADCGGEKESESGSPHVCPNRRKRRTIADEAAEVIAGPRREHYGDPIVNHRRIGVVWGALLDREPIPPRTVAVMMAAMKLVREAGPLAKRDNLVDAVGYLLIAEECA